LQEGLSRQAQRFSAWRLTVMNLGNSTIPGFSFFENPMEEKS
jgi:hypothetical protein